MMLSIITINFNNLNGLKSTCASVLRQTAFSEVCWIIIDGGSTDGSKEYITTIGNNLSYYVSEPDGGIYDAMNKGLQQVHTPYCLYLNSGDSFYSNTVLEQVVPLLKCTDKDIIVGRLAFVHNGNFSHNSPLRFKPSAAELLWNSLPHQASFVKTEVLKNVGGFYTNYKIVSDWAFFVTAILFRNASYEPLDMVIANFDTSGLSSRAENIAKRKAEKLHFIEHHSPEMWKDVLLFYFQNHWVLQSQFVKQLLSWFKTWFLKK